MLGLFMRPQHLVEPLSAAHRLRSVPSAVAASADWHYSHYYFYPFAGAWGRCFAPGRLYQE